MVELTMGTVREDVATSDKYRPDLSVGGCYRQLLDLKPSLTQSVRTGIDDRTILDVIDISDGSVALGGFHDNLSFVGCYLKSIGK
jgi:hypothetical protein